MRSTKLPAARMWGFVVCAVAGVASGQPAGESLPSWNDGEARSAIIEFVGRVTREGSPDYLPPPRRIATFDNDGTLWSEQPVYFQAQYALYRIRSLADAHPEWRETEPFRSAIAGDMKGVMATGKEGLEKLLLAAHANTTADEFRASVHRWLANEKHPESGLAFTQMVYQPMLELLDYLRANGFKTFIVSGGGVDFMRVFAEEVYGIPPEQVIGTTIDARLEMRDGIPTIVKTPELMLFDDGAGKPVGIYRHIGRRPVFAAGNSDGDLQMLQYATIPRGPSDRTPAFALLVHHTDADREWAYDRESHIGRLDRALDEAKLRAWTVVDMQKDWRRVYPGE